MSGSRQAPTVKVIRTGFIVRQGDRIMDASSSVALVESEGVRIVVDTGSPRDIDALPSLFENAGAPPGSVDYVVNTHLHVDHIGCNDLFENARFVAHEMEDPPVGTIKLKKGMDLARGVRLVPTPGHTRGSISVLVAGARKWALAGDAIPTRDNYEKHVPPFINIDPRLAIESMDAILDWAEMVVPGHDSPFEVVRKE